MADSLAEIEARIESLTVPLLVPLRTDKLLDGGVMAELLNVGDALGAALADVAVLPKSLAGKCWSIFTTMLAEADHARNPEPILDAAWSWEEKLRRAFGPKF